MDDKTFTIIGIIAIIVIKFLFEADFKNKSNQRFDKIWSSWFETKEELEKRFEVNERTLNELDVSGELEYYSYDALMEILDDFEYRIEDYTYYFD